MSGSNIPASKFAELLAKAKMLAARKKDTSDVTATQSKIEETERKLQDQSTHEVDASLLGITSGSLQTIEGVEAATEILHDVHEVTKESESGPKLSADIRNKQTGVAADVELNIKQQEFVSTALDGRDICLIGAAGTGKTTCTGKFIRQLIDREELGKVGANTKVLSSDSYGILITSFTRKAVNNIKRALPPELKANAVTMHKALEFEPVFYEIYDQATGNYKNTMKFEPKRNKLFPLPEGIQLIVYEESSMIGTDLYNLMKEATPHLPQEIFIGDIRQLPPIFGPAILGFKMSLLPVVELDEVYRQALLSPIIRLAHAVLSGDRRKFPATIEERIDERTKKPKKFVPGYEQYDEVSEHGEVKIQPWQKKISAEKACDQLVLQLKAWVKSGYFDPAEDIILCPFNKSFGTIEINKGLQQYLGLERGAIVHEVVAGFNKHYLAVGDRVLYDKEDAVITEIRKNLSYTGAATQAPSIHLDRWGCLQVPLSQEEEAKFQKESAEFDMEAVEKFMEVYEEGEDRVQQCSHQIEIQFSYSDEKTILTGAGDVNNLLGGNAITIHKMQGSEARVVIMVLHQSHSMMINNELLYTGITRAREKLHIICEPDAFYKGVATHKVRGRTLKEKIDTFKGKVEFKEMQEEMQLLEKQKEDKEKVRAARVRWKEEEAAWKHFDEAKVDTVVRLEVPIPEPEQKLQPETPETKAPEPFPPGLTAMQKLQLIKERKKLSTVT